MILKIDFLTIPSATLSKISIFNAFQFICLSNGLIEFFKISKLSFHDACNVVMCQTFINIGSLQQPQFQAEPNLRKQGKKTCFAISTNLTLCYFFFLINTHYIHVPPWPVSGEKSYGDQTRIRSL